MPAVTGKQLLVVDDNLNFCTLVRDFFKDRHEVDISNDPHDALLRAFEGHYDLVISDIRMPGMKGPDLLQRVRAGSPDTKTMLITSYNVDHYVKIAREYDISSIMPKTVPFNFGELDTIVHGLLTDDIFGLNRYLLPDGEIRQTYTVRSSEEGRKVRDHAVEVFMSRFGTSGDMKLVLDETITNAIYHAPKTTDGREKYREFSEVDLQPHEYVYVECGWDSEKFGVSVSDSQGKLNKETVLRKIERHSAGEGLLDDSGRGLHMSRLFADTMIINIRRDVRTEVILINYISKKYKGYKPLYINELRAPVRRDDEGGG